MHKYFDLDRVCWLWSVCSNCMCIWIFKDTGNSCRLFQLIIFFFFLAYAFISSVVLLHLSCLINKCQKKNANLDRKFSKSPFTIYWPKKFLPKKKDDSCDVIYINRFKYYKTTLNIWISENIATSVWTQEQFDQ